MNNRVFLLKSIFVKKSTASVLLVLMSLILFVSPILAANPPAPFSPSDKVLDPNCLPTDSNCYVSVSALTFTNATATTFQSTNASLTNATSTSLFTSILSAVTSLLSNLTVTGQTVLANASSSALTISGSLYVTAIQGSGLTSCSNASDKLLYNSTTKQFSCGIDSGAGAGISSLNGVTLSGQTFMLATAGNDVSILSSTSTGVHTFSVPNASLTARGLVSTTTQFFSGIKNFTDIVTGNASATSISLFGALYDSLSSKGVQGMVLQSTGTSTIWVATSSLGITGGGISGGINGYSARFTSSTSVATGVLLDTGTVAGVNATSAATFTVRGSAGLSPLTISSSSGTTFFTILANGNVGIGTTTPTQLLSVGGNILSSGQVLASSAVGLSFSGDTTTGLSLAAPGQLQLMAAGSPILQLNSGGVFDARYALGPALITGQSNTGFPTLIANRADLTTGIGGITGELSLITANTERLKITNGGNIGIGTSTPDSLFTVAGAAYMTTLSLGNALSIGSGGTGGTSSSSARLALGLSYASAQDINNVSTIIAWGDSMTAGSGGTPYPSQLASLTGINVVNQGVGGETSTQIKNRMLADTSLYNYPVIIWSGRNNYADGETIKADIASMVAALGHQNYLIIGVLNGVHGGYEIPGGTGYIQITTLNNELATLYGSRFIDMRAYLVSQYNPAIPQDVIDYNNDTPPSSLRSDTDHLNSAGNLLVAQRIQQSLSTLQGGSQNIITASSIPSILSSPTSIGSIKPNTGYFSELGIATTSGLAGNPLTVYTGNRANADSGLVLTRGTLNDVFGFKLKSDNIGVYRGSITVKSNSASEWESMSFNTVSGYVGIGTTTPTQLLSVGGNILSSGQVLASSAVGLSFSGDTTTGLSLAAPGQLQLITGGSPILQFNGGGVFSAGYINGYALISGQSSQTYPTLLANRSDTTTGIGGITGELSFITANAERLKITNAGNIGIGTSSPLYLLQVGNTGVSGVVARFENSTGYCDINPTTTSLSCTSDIRMKKNIVSIDSSSTLDKLTQLNPVTYNWLSEADDASSAHAGFIAQDVQALFPDLVSTDKAGMLSVSYAGFVPYIVQSVKNIAKDITEFKKALANLVKTNTVETNTLCVGEAGDQTCITKTQLDTMLRNSNQQPVPYTSPSPNGSNNATTTSPTPDTGDTATSTPSINPATTTPETSPTNNDNDPPAPSEQPVSDMPIMSLSQEPVQNNDNITNE